MLTTPTERQSGKLYWCTKLLKKVRKVQYLCWCHQCIKRRTILILQMLMFCRQKQGGKGHIDLDKEHVNTRALKTRYIYAHCGQISSWGGTASCLGDIWHIYLWTQIYWGVLRYLNAFVFPSLPPPPSPQTHFSIFYVSPSCSRETLHGSTVNLHGSKVSLHSILEP